VVFTGNNTFSVLRDVLNLVRVLGKYPHAFNQEQFLRESFNAEEYLPPIVGVSVFGLVILCVNSAECLQDLYVNKNALVTKHSSSSRAWSIIIPQSILF